MDTQHTHANNHMPSDNLSNIAITINDHLKIYPFFSGQTNGSLINQRRKDIAIASDCRDHFRCQIGRK
jgi:hypothetical protein